MAKKQTAHHLGLAWQKRSGFITKRRLIVAMCIFAYAAIVGVQLMYPQGYGLPFATVAGKSVQLTTSSEIANRVTSAFAESRVKLVLDDAHSVEFDISKAGAEPNSDLMVKKVTDYPLWQRLLPGSLLLHFESITTADIFYTNETLDAFIREKSQELAFSPQNARLAIEDGQIIATEATEGKGINVEQLILEVAKAPLVLGCTTVVTVPSYPLAAERYSKDLASVRAEAEAMLDHIITITAAGQSFTPAKAEIASWMLLRDGESGKTTLVLDEEKMRAYLQVINNTTGRPAGQTNITIVDGREIARQTGEGGSGIQFDEGLKRLTAAIRDPKKQQQIELPFVSIQPSVIFNNKYTASEAGLRAYVADVARSRNMRISIRQLDGERWSADARANESIPSASTYKLFVSLVLFDRMDKGEISWSDPMLDTTVAGCFERMTVASTNPCAEAWKAQFGNQNINNFIYERGFSQGTTFTNPLATHTTAADLTKFMIGLNDGTLVSGAHQDKLLDSLGRHPYRYGIPTGSAGRVNDKVGFLWDYVHDTAIVHHPRGTYVMTIMTKGQSYAAIASVTREIERIMYP